MADEHGDGATCHKPKSDAVIAVVNSSEDTVEMLRECFVQNGFTSVVTAHIHDFKTGEDDFPTFLSRSRSRRHRLRRFDPL